MDNKWGNTVYNLLRLLPPLGLLLRVFDVIAYISSLFFLLLVVPLCGCINPFPVLDDYEWRCRKPLCSDVSANVGFYFSRIDVQVCDF